MPRAGARKDTGSVLRVVETPDLCEAERLRVSTLLCVDEDKLLVMVDSGDNEGTNPLSNATGDNLLPSTLTPFVRSLTLGHLQEVLDI